MTFLSAFLSAFVLFAVILFFSYGFWCVCTSAAEHLHEKYGEEEREVGIYDWGGRDG